MALRGRSPFVSREEEAKLARSNKKVKDAHHANFNDDQGYTPGPLLLGNGQSSSKVSFKEKLLGDIPGAYRQAFDLSEQMEYEPKKEHVISALRKDVVAVNLSPEVKRRIRAFQLRALIVKVYGRSVDFNILQNRIISLQKPTRKIDCVDLGNEFFLVRLSGKEDYNAILEKGPQFIGERFLSIRLWEPNLRPFTASVTLIAIWVRLNELPIEYYEAEVLKEIRKSIGNVLRIDTHTALETRGRYARTSVQVDVDKPLITDILIGNLEQSVVYEGIQRLCFSCGRTGHKKETCPYVVRGQRQADNKEEEGRNPGSPKVASPKVVQETSCNRHVTDNFEACQYGTEEERVDSYRPWLVVTRKKHGNKSSRRNGPTGMLSGSETSAPLSQDNQDVGSEQEAKRKNPMDRVDYRSKVVGQTSSSPK